MAAIVPFKSRPQPESIVQPNPRLVAVKRANSFDAIAQVTQESPSTAVIACLSAGSSSNDEVLRKAHAAAREHGGAFYAAFLDSPHARRGKAERRTLIDDAVLAGYLGAKIVWLESSDVVGKLIRFAGQSHVGRIFVARNRPERFSWPFARNVYSDLLIRGAGFRIDVVGFERGN